jgi:hypothetical protein
LSSIEELWLGFILKENRVIRYFLLVFIWNIVRFDEFKNPRLLKKTVQPFFSRVIYHSLFKFQDPAFLRLFCLIS